ncbi:MAG: tetratricopeptide repeat-containing diguanylate cyclase [Desulfobulbaceae bacterium]
MLFPVYSSGIQLNERDFYLFRSEFDRELEKILPVSATTLIWSANGSADLFDVDPERAAEVVRQVKQICAADEPGRVNELLVLPFSLAEGETVAVLLRGVDPGLSQKMAREWLAGIRDQLRTSLDLIKQAHVHPETGLYSSRLLQQQLDAAPRLSVAFFLVGAICRAGTSSTGLLQLVQAARLLETIATGTVYYLGGNLFGIMQENMGRDGALHFARRLLGRLKREGVRKVHIGIAVRGETGAVCGDGSWFNECWQAMAAAERRGPFSLCESSVLRDRQSHPLARPGREVVQRLQRSWLGQDRFGLLLCKAEDEQTTGNLASLLAGCLDPSTVSVAVSSGEVYLVLPGASPEESLRQGKSIQKKLERLVGAGRVAIGISSWPCLNYSKTDTAVNCRKALLHGRFLGAGVVTVFDHLSLNVSGDLYFDEGDYRQAVRDYQTGLRLNDRDVNLMNSLGVTLAELNRQQQAINAFDQVLALEPANFMALVNKGFALRMLGREEEALVCFELIARQKGFSKSAVYADISLQLGRLYCSAGRHREAVSLLEKLEALQAERQGFHLYRLLGQAYAALGKNGKAIRALQRAIRHNPHDAQSLSILGELYAREEQGDDIALSLCQQAVSFDDKPARNWYRLALVREKVGDSAGALAAVRESLRRNRRDVDGLLLAGRLCGEMGSRAQARAMFRRVGKIIPGHREARKALSSLDTAEQHGKGSAYAPQTHQQRQK